MTISSDVKAKVIQQQLEGRGRNEIPRNLDISQGAVSNILMAYRNRKNGITDTGIPETPTQNPDPKTDQESTEEFEYSHTHTNQVPEHVPLSTSISIEGPYSQSQSQSQSQSSAAATAEETSPVDV